MYQGIALPQSEVRDINPLYTVFVLDANMSDDKGIYGTTLTYDKSGAMFIDRPEPHVIYQAKEDFGTSKLWARKADDFFGQKEHGSTSEKRFVRQ